MQLTPHQVTRSLTTENTPDFNVQHTRLSEWLIHWLDTLKDFITEANCINLVNKKNNLFQSN